MFSIIMPAYNSEATITDSIKSVINQTYKKWELIIVDDNSSDKTFHILKSLNDSRIKIIRNNINSGAAKSRNIAISAAQGDFIAFLDSDDIWLPDKLEKQYAILSQSKYAIVCSSYYTFKDDLLSECGLRTVSGEINYSDILKTNKIGCLTAVFDCRKVGKRYMTDCGHEDYTLWLNILRNNEYRCYAIKKPLAYYRIQPNSLSSNKIKMCINQWNIYRKVEQLGLLSSIYYFFCYLFFGFLKRV